MRRLEGKRALVTGGSRGIGSALARRFASEGAAVAITYATEREKAEAVVRAIREGGGRAQAIQAGATDVRAVRDAVARTADAFGGLDVLVNNVGIHIDGPVEEFTLEEFDRTVAVNVRATFVAIKAAVVYMGRGGRIVNIGSVAAERVPYAGSAVYAMSKSALVGLTRGSARDLGPRGITVNNAQPGPVDTDNNPSDGPRAAGFHRLMALPRHGTGEEVASFVTGASLSVDGGLSA